MAVALREVCSCQVVEAVEGAGPAHHETWGGWLLRGCLSSRVGVIKGLQRGEGGGAGKENSDVDP